MVRGGFLISTLYLQYRVHCSSDCALRYPLCSIRTMNLNCIRFFSTEGFCVFEKTRFEIPPLIILQLEVCDTGKFFCFLGFRVFWSHVSKNCPAEFCHMFTVRISIQVLQGHLSFQGFNSFFYDLLLIFRDMEDDALDAFGNRMGSVVLTMKLAETGSQNKYVCVLFY